MSDRRMPETDESESKSGQERPRQEPRSRMSREVDPVERRWWSVTSIGCVLLSLVAPIAFGPPGIVFGIVGRVKGEGNLAIVATALSALMTVIGLIPIVQALLGQA